jgi:hypothetical protein
MTAPKTSGNKLGGRNASLNLTITDDDFDQAQAARSHSGRCMIAQAIVAKYGKESRPIVDSDFIRITNPENGDRLFFRTPPTAAAALISFDAGIKPIFPFQFRANIAFERRARRQSQTPVAEVRKWAREQPEYEGKIADTAPIASDVSVAYREAHPGSKVHTQRAKAITSKATVTPKMAVSTRGQPAVGNLSNANANVPASRRRTWGSRKLTQTLIDQGWVIPDGM